MITELSKNLQNNFLRSLVGLQEVANINKSPLLTGTVFTFEMIPAKFDEFLAVMNKIILKMLEKQCG